MSLNVCKELGEKCMRGYKYVNGLLMHEMKRRNEKFSRIVLPKVRRDVVLGLAHDRVGHVGSKKMRADEQMIYLAWDW